MSYARKITGVSVHFDKDGYLWVSIFFEGKPNLLNIETHANLIYAQPDEPERRARLLKRARQMQGLIMGHWYKSKKRLVAVGNENGITTVDPTIYDEMPHTREAAK